MSFFSRLFSKKNNYSIAEKELIEMNVCPSCWGWEEYQDAYQDKSKNMNHDSPYRKAFIQKFVEENINGIKLQVNNEKLLCPKCHKTYLD